MPDRLKEPLSVCKPVDQTYALEDKNGRMVACVFDGTVEDARKLASLAFLRDCVREVLTLKRLQLCYGPAWAVACQNLAAAYLIGEPLDADPSALLEPLADPDATAEGKPADDRPAGRIPKSQHA